MKVKFNPYLFFMNVYDLDSYSRNLILKECPKPLEYKVWRNYRQPIVIISLPFGVLP